MPKPIMPGKGDKRKFKRFVDTARKLECDEDKERFEESLGKIAAYKPPKKPSKKAAKMAAAKAE